jgi:hypothetical protein
MKATQTCPVTVPSKPGFIKIKLLQFLEFVRNSYPTLSNKAIQVLVPFVAT